jgi:hypothetical protein
MTLLKYPIRQVAYMVPDPVSAALQHDRIFGSGPYFCAEHVPVSDYIYRGKPGVFDHTTVIGQWGEVMAEFFTQHNPHPSHNHDVYKYGSAVGGFHHVAIIPDDVAGAIRDLSTEGFEVAASFRIGGEAGFDCYMVDTRSVNGHMVEIYGNVAPVRGTYEMVKQAAAAGAARETVLPIKF